MLKHDVFILSSNTHHDTRRNTQIMMESLLPSSSRSFLHPCRDDSQLQLDFDSNDSDALALGKIAGVQICSQGSLEEQILQKFRISETNAITTAQAVLNSFASTSAGPWSGNERGVAADATKLDDATSLDVEAEELLSISEGSEYLPTSSRASSVTLPDNSGSAEKSYHSDEDDKIIKPAAKKTNKRKSTKSKKLQSVRTLKKFIDDGDENVYQHRLKKLNNQLLLEQYERDQRKLLVDDDDDDKSSSSENLEDVSLSGGYRIPAKIWDSLYNYQKRGVRWLWELHQQASGGILGDEMGLGKTIQIISFLAGLANSPNVESSGSRFCGLGPVLIVCPTSVMHQWVREFHKWAPRFRVAILHDTGSYKCSKRSLMQRIEQAQNGVLITSYGFLAKEIKSLLKSDWHYVILDEGQKIRNPDAQVTLASKRFPTNHRIISTGSPIQNSLKELWSLFDFIYPGRLGTLPVFMQEFSVPITHGGYANASKLQVQTAYTCACTLRDTISPYLLRRLKSEVQQVVQLPNKNEQVLFCRITPEQRQLYKDYLASMECKNIFRGGVDAFVGLTVLRKLCNHPDLVTGGESDDVQLARDASLAYGHWSRSGKLIVIRALLRLWHKQGHRVLLFSQSRQMLNMLESFVLDENYSYLRMDGSVNIASRQPMVARFNADASLFVFLLSTRVGGLGLNLTGADRVILYDPDWNPATDSQAMERAWRIGQERPVTIYRLLTTGTIEEKIYQRQIFKQFLTNRVLKDPKQRRFFKTSDLHELFLLEEDNESGLTETAALFAGTGSEVVVSTSKSPSSSKSSKRANFFNSKAYTSKKEKSGKVQRSCSDDEDRSCNAASPAKEQNGLGSESAQLSDGVTLSNEAVERLHLLAKKLSQKMGSTGTSSVLPESSTKEQPSSPPMPNDVSSSGDAATESVKKKQDSKKTHREATDSPKRSKSEDPSSLKSAKKKRSEKIPFLAKRQTFRALSLNDEDSLESVIEENKQSARRSRKEDDYVLRKLLGGAGGIHTALKHDAIVGAGSSTLQDASLVDAEARRVAELAARTLRASRQLCPPASSGVPTWTGKHGQARFGRKSPKKLVLVTAINDKAKFDDDYISLGNRDADSPAGKKQKVDKNGKAVTEDVEVQFADLFGQPILCAGKKTPATSSKKLPHSKPSVPKKSQLFAAVSMPSSNCFSGIELIGKEPDPTTCPSKPTKLFPIFERCKRQSSDASPSVVELPSSADILSAIRERYVKHVRLDPDDQTHGQAAAPPGPARPRFGTENGLSLFSGNSAFPGYRQQASRGYSRAVSNDSRGSNNSNSGIIRLDSEDHGFEAMDATDYVAKNPFVHLIDLIRQFIAFDAASLGCATTDELLRQFRKEVPPDKTTLFKAMLKEICMFRRNASKEGVWVLKPEFLFL